MRKKIGIAEVKRLLPRGTRFHRTLLGVWAVTYDHCYNHQNGVVRRQGRQMLGVCTDQNSWRGGEITVDWVDFTAEQDDQGHIFLIRKNGRWQGREFCKLTINTPVPTRKQYAAQTS
jgi:hypothetical protein